MQKSKENTSDMAASAKAGMEKAKATVGGKTEKLTTSDPMRKETAEEKKDERIQEAEREKQGKYDQNAAAGMTQQEEDDEEEEDGGEVEPEVVCKM